MERKYRDHMDIPVKTLDAMRDVVTAARMLSGFRNGGTKTVISKNALRPVWAALDDLDAVSDGPVWECRCITSNQEPHGT